MELPRYEEGDDEYDRRTYVDTTAINGKTSSDDGTENRQKIDSSPTNQMDMFLRLISQPVRDLAFGAAAGEGKSEGEDVSKSPGGRDKDTRTETRTGIPSVPAPTRGEESDDTGGAIGKFFSKIIGADNPKLSRGRKNTTDSDEEMEIEQTRPSRKRKEVPSPVSEEKSSQETRNESEEITNKRRIVQECLELNRNSSITGSQTSLFLNSETSDCTETGQDSGTCRKKRVKSGKMPTKDKEKIGRRVEDLLREVPPDNNELWDIPTNQLGASCIEWMEDIDTIRVRSKTMQGSLSKQMRIRVESIKHALRIFTEKIEEKGDVEYLKRENTKLKAEISANKKQLEKMRTEMDTMRRVVKELQSSSQRENSRGTETSPSKNREKRSALMSASDIGATREKDAQAEKDGDLGTVDTEDLRQFPTLRPPIKGIGTKTPTGKGQKKQIARERKRRTRSQNRSRPLSWQEES